MTDHWIWYSLSPSMLLKISIFCPFYGWIIFQCIYYIPCIFNQSSADGLLGSFHVLAAVNSAAMNTGVQVFFQIMVFSGYMFRSWITRSYSGSTFKGTSILFSIVTAPIYIPTNTVEGFPFSPSPACITCSLFDEAILTGVRWCLCQLPHLQVFSPIM